MQVGKCRKDLKKSFFAQKLNEAGKDSRKACGESSMILSADWARVVLHAGLLTKIAPQSRGPGHCWVIL